MHSFTPLIQFSLPQDRELISPEDQRCARGISGGVVGRVRDFCFGQPAPALTVEEWADLKRKLALCRPPCPVPKFAPAVKLFSS